MATVRGLGRGLGSLIPKKTADTAPQVESARSESAVSEAATAIGAPLIVPIERVLPNPHQPREHFSHTELEDLIISVKEHGILQPLLVTEKADGTYELIAGERRLRAARLAGLTGVPVVSRRAGEQEKLELALVENIQRHDLNPIEEARGYHRLSEEFGLSQDEIALRVGKSRSQIANTLRLLELPEEVQQAVRSGTVPYSAARTLLTLPTKEEQLRFWQRMTAEKMTVREIEEATRHVRGPRAVTIPDANIEADEAAIRTAIGTKASIKKRGEGGTIALAFYSTEEYRALVERLSKS